MTQKQQREWWWNSRRQMGLIMLKILHWQEGRFRVPCTEGGSGV